MGYDIETMIDCASNYGVFTVPSDSDPSQSYTVSFNGSEGPAFCTCQAYKFSSDHHCKHIERVWHGACMYNPQWKEGTADPEFKPRDYTYTAFADTPCPSCGGSAVYVRRAV